MILDRTTTRLPLHGDVEAVNKKVTRRGAHASTSAEGATARAHQWARRQPARRLVPMKQA
jgi:hypothetical protein